MDKGGWLEMVGKEEEEKGVGEDRRVGVKKRREREEVEGAF